MSSIDTTKKMYRKLVKPANEQLNVDKIRGREKTDSIHAQIVFNQEKVPHSIVQVLMLTALHQNLSAIPLSIHWAHHYIL